MRSQFNVRDTNANDDLVRGSRDRVDGRLWKGDLAAAKEGGSAAKVTHLIFGPMEDNLTELPNERDPGTGFRVGFLVSGLGVGDTAKVLVEVLLQKIQVPLFESLDPLLHEFDLWRNGHCDEATKCKTSLNPDRCASQ